MRSETKQDKVEAAPRATEESAVRSPKRLLTLALGVAATTSLLLSLVTPWWETSIQSPEIRTYRSYGLLTVCSQNLFWGRSCTGSDREPEAVAGPLRIAVSFVLAGLAVGIVHTVLPLWNQIRRRMPRWATVLGVADVILTLVPPLYLAAVLPGAFGIAHVQWLFSSTTLPSGAVETYGVSTGWFAAVAAFVCTLVANTFLRIDHRRVSSSGS